jgi:hypothetical protein
MGKRSSNTITEKRNGVSKRHKPSSEPLEELTERADDLSTLPSESISSNSDSDSDYIPGSTDKYTSDSQTNNSEDTISQQKTEDNDSGEEDNDSGEEDNDSGEEDNDSGEEDNDSGEEDDESGEEDDESEVGEFSSSTDDDDSSSEGSAYLKREEPELYQVLNEVQSELKKSEPNIRGLLTAPLSLPDRAKLCQLYELYRSIEPNTLEWLEIRIRYNSLLKTCLTNFKHWEQISPQIRETLKKEEEKLRNKDTKMGLKYKILSLDTSPENKAIIYRRFEELQSQEGTDEYGKLKQWLDWAIHIPHNKIKQTPSDNITSIIKRASNHLESHLFGMDKVKEQILLFMSAKLSSPGMKQSNLGLVGPPGVGKCLAKDTPIIMYSGEVKLVQHIQMGDILMGDDSTPRYVQSTINGHENMYKISQSRGVSYTVNESHILTLKTVRRVLNYDVGEKVDIPLRTYLGLTSNQQQCFKGFRARTEFRQVYLPYDPYEYALALGKSLRRRVWCPRLFAVKSENPQEYRIPFCFKVNHHNYRLSFLAGLIDASGGYILETNSYQLTGVREGLHKDIAFVAHSLGFECQITTCKNRYTLLLSGTGLNEIPVCKTPKAKFQGFGDVLSEIHITPLGLGEYYGFTIDGNHRFLLGDFTVTHNTALARMVASIMDWGFEQISFGGVERADFLKGHEYTYVGAQPGAIVKALRRMGHKNGVIFLDELEKAANHKDIKAALLHILDRSQNSEFRDHYLGDITVDLSQIWYIGSMNSLPSDSALADRWWVIDVPGYSVHDKVSIVCEYLLPKALENASCSKKEIIIPRDVCRWLVRTISKEEDKGVRTLQKTVEDIVNKLKFLATHQDETGELPFPVSFQVSTKVTFPITLTKQILDKILYAKDIDTFIPHLYL